MDFEHTYTERTAQASSLEETARRSAKAAAWSLGIHVADPEGTMKQMFQKFIGSKLQRQEEMPETQEKGEASSSSSSSSKKKKKKKEKKKEKKPKKERKAKGRKDEKAKNPENKKRKELLVRLKHERQAGDEEVAVDPKFAKIIDRFRQNVNPLIPNK